MTTYTPILVIPEVDPNQNQKEATIVTGILMLEAAGEDVITKSLAADVTLTALEWTTAKLYLLTSSTADHILNVPATKRFAAFRNTGTNAIVVQVTGGAGKKIAVQSGAGVIAYCDGTDVSMLGASGAGAMRVFTANHTLAAADAFSSIEINAAGATTLTIPASATAAMPLGVPIRIYQKGAGQITVAVTGGPTLAFPSDKAARTRHQDSVIFAEQIATDVWVVYGDIG